MGYPGEHWRLVGSCGRRLGRQNRVRWAIQASTGASSGAAGGAWGARTGLDRLSRRALAPRRELRAAAGARWGLGHLGHLGLVGSRPEAVPPALCQRGPLGSRGRDAWRFLRSCGISCSEAVFWPSARHPGPAQGGRRPPCAPGTGHGVRERVKIRSASQGVEAPGWQGVKRANIAGYLTDEQRSQPGWIGVPSAEFILTRSLNARLEHGFGFSWGSGTMEMDDPRGRGPATDDRSG